MQPDDLARAIRERNQARGQVSAIKGQANTYRRQRNAAMVEEARLREELAKLRAKIIELADKFEDQGQADVAQALWAVLEE